MLLVLAVSAVAGGLLLWSNRTATEQTEGENKLPTVNKKDEDASKKEQTYKILVKNAEGSPIQGILAAFYDKAGNVVGEPGTTNNMGAITLKTEETNIASAKVLAVPYEYELNKEFHEFKASKKSVSIVLKKFAIIVAIICILLCITVGLVALLGDGKKQGDNSPQTYSVFIKDEYDKPISGIHLKLYYGGGETLTKSPVLTDENGAAAFEEITEPDCWAEVEYAPVEFEINENARYYFDDNNETTIIMKDNKDVTELANYEASIGRARYATFTEALEVANQSTQDVTITLASDISIFELELKNENSINVTIDGGGHTLASAGGNHAFKINQGDCVIEFKNMTVNHGNKGSFIQDYLGNTIKLRNIYKSWSLLIFIRPFRIPFSSKSKRGPRAITISINYTFSKHTETCHIVNID